MPVAGEGGRLSPKNLMVTAVGDWLQEASPQSKVVSIEPNSRELAGDDGVMPLPEYLTNVEHRSARRFDNSREIARKLIDLDTLDRIVTDGVINYAAAGKAGIHDRTLEIAQDRNPSEPQRSSLEGDCTLRKVAIW